MPSLLDIKIAFNDIVLRELDLSVDEYNHVCDDEHGVVFTIKDKFLTYYDEEYPMLKYDEELLNLLENPRMMEVLFGVWVDNRAKSKGLSIVSMYQSSVRGTNKAQFVVNYKQPDNSISEVKSGVFLNESVRILHLICILNHTDHLYDFNLFDIDFSSEETEDNNILI